MAEIRRCVKKKIVRSPVLDANIYICLRDKPVLRVEQIINTGFQKRSISVMCNNGNAVKVLNYFICYKINLIVNRIKKIRHRFYSVRSEPVIGIKKENILSVRPRESVISRFRKPLIFLGIKHNIFIFIGKALANRFAVIRRAVVNEKDFDILKADRLLGQRSKTAFDKFFNIIDGNNHRRLVFRH